MEWQPAETAPRDHEPFVAWRPDAGWFVAEWTSPALWADKIGLPEDAEQHDDWDEQFWSIEGDDLSGAEMFTHWMRPTDPEPE